LLKKLKSSYKPSEVNTPDMIMGTGDKEDDNEEKSGN